MHKNERNFIFLNKCQNARLVIYKRRISGRDALLFCCVHTEDMLIQHLHAKSCFHCNRKLAQQRLVLSAANLLEQKIVTLKNSFLFLEFVHTHCYCFVRSTSEIKTTTNYLNHEAYQRKDKALKLSVHRTFISNFLKFTSTNKHVEMFG